MFFSIEKLTDVTTNPLKTVFPVSNTLVSPPIDLIRCRWYVAHPKSAGFRGRCGRHEFFWEGGGSAGCRGKVSRMCSWKNSCHNEQKLLLVDLILSCLRLKHIAKFGIDTSQHITKLTFLWQWLQTSWFMRLEFAYLVWKIPSLLLFLFHAWYFVWDRWPLSSFALWGV